MFYLPPVGEAPVFIVVAERVPETQGHISTIDGHNWLVQDLRFGDDTNYYY